MPLYAVHKRGGIYGRSCSSRSRCNGSSLRHGSAEDLEAVTDQITSEGDAVQFANINCPGQIVISGTVNGVEKAGALAKEKGAKRAIPLVVSGPFHSSLMKPAAEKLRDMLDDSGI